MGGHCGGGRRGGPGTGEAAAWLLDLGSLVDLGSEIFGY